jgi:O-antigen/teichoic acid export membrane protein
MQNKSIFTSFSLVLSLFINTFILFFISRIIISEISVEAYGIYNLAFSFNHIYNLLTISITSIGLRFIILNFIDKKTKLANRYIVSILYFLFVLFLLSLFLLLLFSNNIAEFINIPIVLLNDFLLLLVFSLISYFIEQFSNLFSSYYVYSNKVWLKGLLDSILSIFKALLLYFLFQIFNPQIWIYGFALLLVNLLKFVFLLVFNLKLKILSFKLTFFSFSILFELFKIGFWNLVNYVGGLFTSGLNNLIANLYFTLYDSALVAINHIFYGTAISVMNILNESFQPKASFFYAKEMKDELTEYLYYASSFFSLVAFLILSGFFFLGDSFFTFWLNETIDNSVFLIIMIGLLSIFLSSSIFPFFTLFSLTKKLKVSVIISFMSGIFNLIVVFVLNLFTNFGIVTIFQFSLLLISIITNLILNPILLNYIYDINIVRFYKVVLRNILYYLVCFSIVFLFLNTIKFGGFYDIVFRFTFLVIFSIIYYYFIILDFKQKKFVLSELNFLKERLNCKKTST